MTHCLGASANQLGRRQSVGDGAPAGQPGRLHLGRQPAAAAHAEEEQGFARRLREHNDLEAAGALVLSHLRLVVSIRAQYLGYGLPHGDLIQEGNIGLMKAVKRFDPDQGVRLVSYAMHWIKAEIHEYILKNWRMVKVATTKAQRKLFFNLRSMKQGFKADADAMTPPRHPDRRRDRRDGQPAQRQARRSDRDGNPPVGRRRRCSIRRPTTTATKPSARSPTWPTPRRSRPRVLEVAPARPPVERRHRHRAGQLDARSRRIVEERWLKVNDDGSGGMTLHDLAAEYGVSAERIRQIEVAAMKKMKKALAAYALEPVRP